MTTNRVRKDVIRERMAATGESYNVAARGLLQGTPKAEVLAALRVQRWLPGDSLDVPCPCGGTCEPGENCGRCDAPHRHVARSPGSTVDVDVWEDRYDCPGCSASYCLTVVLTGRPWGVVAMVPQGGGAEPVARVRVFPGVMHPQLEVGTATAG
ncbi:hypothetical protein [Kitasatospora sp. MAP5-34]|uniref:hypothetical protein n=1 Tax=Kitasatospora sp. MAP5-34 TaxID=3035102 RepID=UPI0024760545|nr:hypothetical protein [Kitasatospora sp. MAP5-34]MDH6575976.1 hypothetical protein [Kitasatospora sp. MAP5-34]